MDAYNAALPCTYKVAQNFKLWALKACCKFLVRNSQRVETDLLIAFISKFKTDDLNVSRGRRLDHPFKYSLILELLSFKILMEHTPY